MDEQPTVLRKYQNYKTKMVNYKSIKIERAFLASDRICECLLEQATMQDGLGALLEQLAGIQ